MLQNFFHHQNIRIPGQIPGNRKQRMRDGILTSLYWIIPVIVTVFLLTLFVGTYILTHQEQTTAAIINDSGRQRLRALEIAFLSRSMALETSVAARRPLRDRLQKNIKAMAQAHDSLTGDRNSDDIPQTIRQLYFSGKNAIDSVVGNYLIHARRLIENWQDINPGNSDLAYILREGPTTVVRNLDMLVSQYQKEGEKSIASILRMERIILAIGFLLFLAQVIYFFLPLVSRIKGQDKEIVESRRSLSESRYYTDQLLHALNEHAVVSIADIKGNIIYANSKFCELSGYSVSELVGANHRILKSDAHDKVFFSDLWATIASGQTWRGEICNKARNGEFYWVQSTIVPFLSQASGMPEQYVAIQTNITDHKKTLDRMDRLYLQAEAASVAKSEFLSNMSHELRTPLGHIIGFSQLLMMKILDPDVLENVEYIKNAGDDLLDKVNSFLEFISEEGKEDRNPGEIDIVQLLNNEFVEYFRILARRSKRKFTKNIPDREIYVRADSLELLSAFRKIAINAVQFSDENDIVGVAVTLREDSVEITIFDTGPCLPAHILSGSFDPFEIGEPVMTKIKSGMGLGLPLAKKLCLQNGGTFDISSEKGIGTKIYFRFPVIQPPAE